MGDRTAEPLALSEREVPETARFSGESVYTTLHRRRLFLDRRGPVNVQSGEGHMDHARTMRSLYDLINAGDIDGFGRLLADDFTEREALPGFPTTKAGVIQYFRMMLAAFPDLRMTPEDVIAGGDKVVARVRVTGTHKGPFMGMSATGKRIEVKVIDITRFGDDGRAHEHWGLVDELAMMQQLGAIPATPPA